MQNEHLVTFLGGDAVTGEVIRQQKPYVFEQRLLRTDLDLGLRAM